MGWLKKNPIFFVSLLLLLLVFAAGVFLALRQKARFDEAEQELRSAESRLRQVRNASPAPSEANVKASERNVEKLKSVLASIRSDLETGSRVSASTDGVRVMAGIQQYISDFQKTIAQTGGGPADGESAQGDGNDGAGDTGGGIRTPEDFAFGFREYIDEASVPEREAAIPLLDKQRQILTYVLNQLIASGPEAIAKVEREIVEIPPDAEDGGGQRATGFTISPAVSARVPGAIDTMAFRVTFTGFTDVLRTFLNRLAEFELPIVVRSIEVDRPEGRGTTARSGRGGDNGGNDLDNIFGVFGGGQNGGDGEAAAETREQPEQAQEPVIEENISEFTVSLEYIEILLSDSEKTDS